MSNEPRLNSKALAVRLDLEDFARVLQVVETDIPDENGKVFNTISDFLRVIIHHAVMEVELEDKYKKWVLEQIRENAERRMQGRRGRMYVR